MEKIFTFILVLFFSSGSAQILNQDESGNSSIVVSGGSIGLDFKETLLKANYYSPTDKNRGILWGLDLQGKNKTGVSTLFSNREFTPESKLSFLFGYFFSNVKRNGDFDKKNKLARNIEDLEEEESRIIEKIEEIKYLSDYVEKLRNAEAIDIAIKLSNILDKPNYLSYQKSISNLIFYLKKDERTTKILNILRELTTRIDKDENFNNYVKTSTELENQRNELKNFDRITYKGSSKHKFYVRPVINALEFKIDTENLTQNFLDRFHDTLEVFGAIELGFTSRINDDYFGANITYGGVSSLRTLPISTYSFTSIDSTIKDGLLTRTTEVTAFSGNYFKERLTSIRVDWVKLLSYNQKKSSFLAIGLFFNRNWFTDSNNFDRLENFSSLGTFINLIDGKKGQFVGGIYLQSSDIFGETDNGFEKSINFGVTTKYVINNPISTRGKSNLP